MPATPLNALPPVAAEGGSFLVTPDVGLMIWTLLVFGVAMFILWKLAFPPISAALEKRQRMIEDSIDHAERTRVEADEVLAEYRERLKEARVQAEEIISRAHKAGVELERESREQARQTREDLLEQTKRDVEAETRKAVQDIRREVAELTVAATEHVTRRVLSEDDQRRLIDEALEELDFEVLGERR